MIFFIEMLFSFAKSTPSISITFLSFISSIWRGSYNQSTYRNHVSILKPQFQISHKYDMVLVRKDLTIYQIPKWMIIYILYLFPLTNVFLPNVPDNSLY